MERGSAAAKSETNNETVRQAARRYIGRKWKPLPVARGRKGPTRKDWPAWEVGDADEYVKEHFTGALVNVAVQLGKRSDGLVDVDLDCLEAVRLAPEFLPETKSVFGRTSKRRAHHFYKTDLCETEPRAVIPFKETKALNEKEVMLVELRIGAGSSGAATLAPPSVHPNGELITWDSDGDPAVVDGEDLKKRCAMLAAATLLVRHYPGEGGRHAAALVLGGVLARASWDVKNIEWFVGAIAQAAGDKEADDRILAATSAVEQLEAGEDTPGLPRMRTEWGAEVADLFAQWIGYDANGAKGGHSSSTSTAGDSQTAQLIALAEAAELFHTREGACYADVLINGHRETWPLTSKGSGGFALWLRHQFYQATAGAPNSQALTAAVNTLAAKARYDGPVNEVYVRIAAVDGRVYLDLCDEDWRVVEIDDNGWGVVTEAPVRFLRRRGMLPLPIPEKHTAATRRKAIDKLYGYVNVASDADFALLISFLLAALSGRGPFVVLVVLGEPGAAKSTLERLLKELVDPNKAPLRAPPREARDLFVAANNAYLIAFDNFSELPGWLSDMLCRLSTGGGFGTRQLYTDEDEMLFDAMRPVVLTCIDNVIIRGDLTDRAIFLTLLAIPENKRRHQRDFWAAFDRDKAAILVKSHPSPTPFRVQGRPPAGCQCFCSDEAETGVAEPHIAEQSRSWRARVASGRLCAVLEAPAVVAGLDDVAVVGEPIEHGGCHFGVAEHLRPIGEGQIGGDQQ